MAVSSSVLPGCVGSHVVALHGVTRRYARAGLPVDALRGVDLLVEPGELVLLMGPSGCGKTTLLHVLGGLDRADSGTAVVAGVDLMAASQAELDRYWEQLSTVPEAEQCGWCADRFGLSWQLVPVNLGELMTAPDSFEKLMGMKKIEIAAFG